MRMNRLLNIFMVLFLAATTILVFMNAMLRYLFESGIPWSEEMARFLFIWMCFLGAIGALKDNQHLNVDLLINKLPRPVKYVVYLLGNGLVLFAVWSLLHGSWRLTMRFLGAKAPVTGISMGFVYGVGIVLGVGMAIVVLYNLYRLFFKKSTIDDLTRSSGVEGVD
jgi:TRAP-type C4-dicarboxylate transport system permease small subunit